jgi:hypothetical protein
VALSPASWERFIHDRRNALFALQLQTERTRSLAHESRARAAETRLRARGLRAMIAANLRRCAVIHARAIAALTRPFVRPDGDVVFEDARIVYEGIVLVVEVEGRRAGIPRHALRAGTEVQLVGERGRLVISRELARDQGLLSVVAEEIRDRLLGETAAG